MASPLQPSISSSTAPDACQVSTSRPLRGVSSAGFAAFVSAAGGRSVLEGKTTDWVKAHLIFKLTSAAAPCLPACELPGACADPFWVHAQATPPRHTPGCGGSYADALALNHDGAALVGEATVFLSHAYAYLFLDAVDAVESWEARHPRAGGGKHYFYFDLLVVNQHAPHMVVPFEELRDEFGSGVRGVGCTLFLLSWANPLSLGRAWCVFEIAVSLECDAKFECVLPPRDEAAFAAALEDDVVAAACKLTDAVDARAAKAAMAADKEHIDALIANSLGGHHKVDALVVGALRRWTIKCGADRLARMHSEEAAVAPLKRELGVLYLLERSPQGIADAERHFEESYKDCLSVRGAGHPETAFSACRHGRALANAGRVVEGEALLRSGLAGLRAARGAGGARAPAWYAEALAWHAWALSLLGREDEAEALAQECVAARRETLGATHMDTFGALVDLGGRRLKAGRLGEAQTLIEEGLAGYRAVVPSDNHPYLLWALSEHARLLEGQGRLAAAAALFEGELLRGLEKRYGEAGAETRKEQANLARVKGKLEAAAAAAGGGR